MKKLFIMLLILFTLYLGIQFAFNFFSPGDSNSYTIEEGNKEFEVYEKSYFASNNNNYSYSIKTDKTTFNFQIDENFNKENQILKSIKYFNDTKYECILPIFKGNKVVIDVVCYDGNKTTYYYNIKGKNKNLDKFVLDIEEYKLTKFTDITKSQKIENIDIYKENLVKDHYLALTNYKGVYNISSNFNAIVYNITLFYKDIYNPKISAFINNYYITADYDNEYNFRKFNIIDLVRLDTNTVTTNYKISFDSYIQGIVDNKMYIYDFDNKTQYEIDVEKETVVPYTGNSLKYYDKGTWTTMTTADANKGLKFKYEEVDMTDDKYSRIDKIGEDVGYYYLYKKNGKVYDVYSMDIQNKDSLKYVFSTTSIDNISYADEYVYFINNNKVQLFSHEFGIKNIVEYKELQFNKNLNMHVYSK